MATKKQKRALGEAKQAIHRADSIASGLKAQKRDHEMRAQKKRDAAIQAKRPTTAQAIRNIAAPGV